MSLRRAAPGPQLSTGRIRVDAGKAIAKLREYQLANRNAWVLEAIRAAVAAKATRIVLDADANDVWLSWEGAPWADDVLPRLFDELVSPEAASETQHVRLLAAAVNSALGMEPAYVDVMSIRDGSATRVRYTPEILLAPAADLGESTLRHVAAEPVPVPQDALPGVRVHVRRRVLDWRVFSEAPELQLARDACRDISIPLRIGEHVFHRDAAADIVRLPLGEGLDGFIAVTEVGRADFTASLEVAEHGVVLVEYVLDELRAPVPTPEPFGRMPIRVFVDAPRMPTNASRSQVRRDAHPIDSAERQAHELFEALIEQLAARAQTEDRARTAALALIAAHAGGTRWHVDVPAMRGPLRQLAALPLVKNAVGQERPLTSHWRAEVHTGGRPFDAELAPWLEQVLWIPDGDAAAQLVPASAIDTRGTRRLVRWARRQLRAQKKFYAHQKREIRVLTSATAHVRAPLGVAAEGSTVADSAFEGLTGEVCIYAEGHIGALVVLLEGRELERIEFDSPLAFDVVIDSARVTPADRYRGVKRDAEYKRVERAMRAGLVRALEAHALANRDNANRFIDAALFRRGFGVMREIGAAVKGPLARAPAYATVDGGVLSLTELAKEKTIGIAPPGLQVAVPRDRVVIALSDADATQLDELVGARFVAYRNMRGMDVDAVAGLAARVAGAALVIREPGLVAIVAPSRRSELRLHHMGVELGSRSYLSSWLPCAITIDADAIVPAEEWTKIADDAGLGKRDYGAWELALVRGIAGMLVGSTPPALVSTQLATLDSPLGLVLCEAISKHDSKELLGDELVARLRTAPLVRMLGEVGPCSIAQAAERFSGAIPYIDHAAVPVDGYTPIVASKLAAIALAKLVGRTVVDGAQALESHRRKAIRARNLAAHRTQPQAPMTIPADHVVPLTTRATIRGLAGIRNGPFEIRVFVEGRPFDVVWPPDIELGLVAAVEIPESLCGETFEKVPDDTRKMLAMEVRAMIPALVAAVAKAQPHLLGDPGAARALLARAWSGDAKARDELREVPAFRTIQGERVSIEQAAHPRLVVSVASWEGEWLGPDDESPHALDAPILFVHGADDEISAIIEKLHRGSVVDVTDDVTRLQSRRRIARGLVPMPRVAGVPAELKRSLADLGPAGKALGIGEIALVEGSDSVAYVHRNGQRVSTERLDVIPTVQVAVELAEPQSLQRPVQQLADLLAKQVIDSVMLDALSPQLQRNLIRAAFARRLDRDALASMTSWRELRAQIEQFGNAWIMCEPTLLEPLDPERKVFFFEKATFDLARSHEWPVINAQPELELDAIARVNRSRPRAMSLDHGAHGVLGETMLGGDGVTGPCGTVAVLSPSMDAVRQRGLWPHANMHPFDCVADPCRWPTIAKIEDARLQPDRTWSVPQPDGTWQAIMKEVRQASEQALATLGTVPDDALTHVRITQHACAEVAALRKAPKSAIRGVLWLGNEPRRKVSIRVTDHSGAHWYVPTDGMGIGGELFVFTPDNLDIDAAIEQLCGQTHGALVRQLMKSDHPDDDLVAAHVAHALFLRTLRATEARAIHFGCFSPRSLDGRALSSLFKRSDPVIAIKPDATPNPDPSVVELIENRTLLSQTISADLGPRVRRALAPPKPRPARETAPPPPPPKQQPYRAPKPEPEHPLMPLVKKLRARLSELGIGGYRWSIIERGEPMFSFSDEIEIAGDNARLRALAAAMLSNSPLFESGLDIVVAHLVTVLNVALTQITDASEAHALGVLLSRPSADRQRSRRSS